MRGHTSSTMCFKGIVRKGNFGKYITHFPGKSYIRTLILSHVYILNKQLLSLVREVIRQKTNYVPPLPLKSQSSSLLQRNWEKANGVAAKMQACS